MTPEDNNDNKTDSGKTGVETENGSAGEKTTNLDSFKKKISKEFCDFMETKLGQGVIIHNVDEVVKKYESDFFSYLRNHGKGSYIQQYKDTIGWRLNSKEIEDVEIDGGMIFDDYWRNILHKTLDEKKNQTYYELLVKNYGKGCNEQLGNGGAGEWETFLKGKGLPLTMESFGTTAEQKKQLAKGKVPWNENLYQRLISAFRIFSQKKGLTPNQQDAVVKAGKIKNSTFIKALRDKELYSEKFAKQTINGIDYKGKTKKKLDSEVEGFWEMQDAILRMDVEKTMKDLPSFAEKTQRMDDMMRNKGMIGGIFTKHPIKKYLQKHPSSGQEKSISDKSSLLGSLQNQFVSQKDKNGKKLSKQSMNDLEKQIESLIREIEHLKVISQNLMHDESVIDDYLTYLGEQTKENPMEYRVYKIFEKHNKNLGTLSGSATADGRDGAYKKDTVDLLRYLAGINAKKHMDQATDMLGDIAKQYGLEKHKEQYQQFMMDIYDPTKMVVEMPGYNGSTKKIRFAKKALHVDSHSLHDALIKNKNLEDIFTIDLEISGIDGVDLEEFELAKISMFAPQKINDKTGKKEILAPEHKEFTRFIDSSGSEPDITLKRGRSYTIHAKNNEYRGNYTFMTISANSHVDADAEEFVLQHVLVPNHLVGQVSDDRLSDEYLAGAQPPVVRISSNNAHEYRYAAHSGMQVDGDTLATLHVLYHQNEEERKEFSQKYDISYDKLGNYINTEDLGFKHLKNNLDEWMTDTPTDREKVDSETRDTELWRRHFRNIGFADQAPDATTHNYTYRNEGKIVARIDEGKVMIHAGNLEKQFNFSFVRDKDGSIIHPPKFLPQTDDGQGPRSLRDMFGNNDFDPLTKKWTLKKGDETPLWNQSKLNEHGHSFFTYLKSLVAHEKTHRFLKYGEVDQVKLYGKITLDQELLCEISEWLVAPKNKKGKEKIVQDGSLSTVDVTTGPEIAQIFGMKKGAKQSLVNVLGGEGGFLVDTVDIESSKVRIVNKREPKKTIILDIEAIESIIWLALLENASGKKKEKLDALKEKYDGKFFSIVRKLDTLVAEQSTHNESSVYVEDFEGYIDMALNTNDSGFGGFLAASTEKDDASSSSQETGSSGANKNPDTSEQTHTTPTVEKVKKHGTIERMQDVDPSLADKSKFYVYGDNEQLYGVDPVQRGSDAVWDGLAVLQGLKRLPVRTMHTYMDYMSDINLEDNKKKIDEDIARIRKVLRAGEDVVIRYRSDQNRWLVGRKLGEMGAPATYTYVQDQLEQLYQESLEGNIQPPQVSPPDIPDDPSKNIGANKVLDESTDVDASMKTIDANEEPERDWKSVFEEFGGDKSLGIDDTPAIMFRVNDSKLQGFGSVWMKGNIEKSGTGYAIILEGTSEGDLAQEGLKGRRIHLNSPADLERLYKKTREGMYKFKELNNKKEFFEYIMGDGGLSDIVNGGKLKWTDQYMKWDSSSGKIMKQYDYNEEQRTDEWSYIGKAMDRGQHMGGEEGHPDDSVLEFYKIQQYDSHVTVEAVTGKYKFKQDMDWTTFMVFMTEKGMHPYSEKEYKAQKEETHTPLRGATKSIWDHFMSINSVIAAFKKFPEAFKYRMEQNEKFEASKLYQQLAETLLPNTNLFNLNDIKADADSELDTNIMQVIQGYSERLSRKEGDNKGVHGNRACERIEREIFLNIRHNQAYKHRAAGYLSWLADNEGNPYPRNLSRYAGTGMWVRVLLGERQQQEFLKWRRWKHDEVKNQGLEDEENMHDYAFMELLFIQERCDDTEYVKKLYGSRFPKKIEMAIEVMGSAGRLEKVRGGVDDKGSVYAVINEAKSKLKKLQPCKAYATIENLAERCEEPHHYHAFYKVLMQTMVSGVGSYTFSNTLKGKIKQIGRTFGVPFCLMIKDIHHPRKTTRIIDNIAKNNGIPSLTSFIQKNNKVPSNWNASDLNESNYTENMRHTGVIDAVGERWSEYGYIAMDSLNNMDFNMLTVKGKKGEKETDETNQALDYYKNKLFDGERDSNTAVNDNAAKAVLNPMFQHGVLNFQKPAFNKLFQSSTNREGQMTGNTREMWKHLKRKVDGFGQDLNGMRFVEDNQTQKVYNEKFEILFRKFCEYFKEDFADVDQDIIIERFKSGNIVDTKDSVLSLIAERKFMNSLRDGVAQKTVKSFLEVFDENKHIFKDNPNLTDEFRVTI